jgi:hypothetical protein
MSEATAQSASNAASAGALELSCFQQFIVAYDTIDGKVRRGPSLMRHEPVVRGI